MKMRPRLKPVLAPLQVASLALGCVIGFGCFILAGDFLETAGPLGAALGITLGGAGDARDRPELRTHGPHVSGGGGRVRLCLPGGRSAPRGDLRLVPYPRLPEHRSAQRDRARHPRQVPRAGAVCSGLPLQGRRIRGVCRGGRPRGVRGGCGRVPSVPGRARGREGAGCHDRPDGGGGGGGGRRRLRRARRQPGELGALVRSRPERLERRAGDARDLALALRRLRHPAASGRGVRVPGRQGVPG